MPYLIDQAKHLGLNDICVFAMTEDEWACIAKLFPARPVCEAYIDYIREVCEILREHSWFYYSPIKANTYKYCVYYPDCSKCRKDSDDPNIWSDNMPSNFPPIDTGAEKGENYNDIIIDDKKTINTL